jgi:hypothetical protein
MDEKEEVTCHVDLQLEGHEERSLDGDNMLLTVGGMRCAR